jgi:hypothetical protein
MIREGIHEPMWLESFLKDPCATRFACVELSFELATCF